jgi:transposase
MAFAERRRKMMRKSWKKVEDSIREVYAETGSLREVARRVGCSRKLVRRVIRGVPPLPRKPTRPRPSKLDPYKPRLRRLIEEDGLTAILALEEIRGLGYDGGYSILKDFVRTIRPAPLARATTVVEHAPGAEGQVDWSPYEVLLGGVPTMVNAFLMTLPFSRYSFLRYAMDQKEETLLRLHDEGFEDLGVVPTTMSYDNMMVVGRHIGAGEVWINPRFAEYAAKYGFEIRLITPGKPNEHANVERTFLYNERNCLLRRRSRFDDLDDLNRHAKAWCDNVANVRVHGMTRQRPVDRLRYEKSFCKPLPWNRPEVYEVLARKVSTDHCVVIDTNRYSVSPRYVGRPVTVHLFDERLEIVIDGEVHAMHVRSREPYQRFVLPEHEEEYKRSTPSRRLLEQAFLRLGNGAKTYYEGLCAQRGRGAGYHLKRILRLADRHGATVVIAAMTHAARFGSYSAEAVARVIAGRTIGRDESATPTNGAPMPPERVRRWLEGLDVEGRDLGDYDEVIDGLDGDDDAER